MRVIFRMSAIVAALAIVAGGALAGCGQRGPLYMPTVPPLPPKPNFQTQPPQPPAPAEPAGSVPDTSGTPLSLTPDDSLSPSPSSPAAPEPASETKPTE